jgi:hypothetical protein
MEMGLISDVTYTKEEEELCVKLCTAINADKELAMFFKERLGIILKKFAKDIIFAYTIRDKQQAKATTMKAGEMVKALIMHMYVKVKIKEKEVKP